MCDLCPQKAANNFQKNRKQEASKCGEERPDNNCSARDLEECASALLTVRFFVERGRFIVHPHRNWPSRRGRLHTVNCPKRDKCEGNNPHGSKSNVG
jgi:hypothetical protein